MHPASFPNDEHETATPMQYAVPPLYQEQPICIEQVVWTKAPHACAVPMQVPDHIQPAPAQPLWVPLIAQLFGAPRHVPPAAPSLDVIASAETTGASVGASRSMSPGGPVVRGRNFAG